MQGIELSRRFYFDVVCPWLSTIAPGLPHAAALIGSGSELLGFDDETSKDHNWGPRVQLFVFPHAFNEHAGRIVEAFLRDAPGSFLGEPIGWRCRPNAPPDGEEAVGRFAHGVEVFTLAGSLRTILGLESVTDITPRRWLALPEQRLLAFTAGAVFHDDGIGLEDARGALAYFPKDVWLYKIACQWGRIAEEQAFVGRAGQVGDDLGSRVIAGRLVRDIMRLGFLLERQYAPYPKWFGRAFAQLPIAIALAPLLDRALLAANWQERGNALAAAYLVLANRQREDGIGGHFEPVIGPYHDRPFPTINTDDLVAASLSGIEEPQLRQLPLLGSLDQVTDLTPLVENPSRSARMMQSLLEV